VEKAKRGKEKGETEGGIKSIMCTQKTEQGGERLGEVMVVAELAAY